MKNPITFIVIGAFIIGAFLIGKSCNDDIAQTAINELKAKIPPLEAQVKELEKEKITLADVIDSLKSIPPKIDERIVYLQAEVDSSIAEDSLNAFAEYKKGLTLLDIRPDATPILTIREIGHGALIFRETYGMRLKIPVLQETIDSLDSFANNLSKTIDLKDNIIGINNLTIEAQDLMIKKLDGFWKNRIVLYVGAGGSYDGITIKPALHLGMGIRIWGND